MTAKHVIFLNNTGLVQLNGLKDAQTKTPINDAVVTITLKDADDVEVPGETWPVALSYVDGSDGNYSATFSDLIEVQDETDYTMSVTVTALDGSKASWDEPVTALVRSAENQLKRWWPAV